MSKRVAFGKCCRTISVYKFCPASFHFWRFFSWVQFVTLSSFHCDLQINWQTLISIRRSSSGGRTLFLLKLSFRHLFFRDWQYWKKKEKRERKKKWSFYHTLQALKEWYTILFFEFFSSRLLPELGSLQAFFIIFAFSHQLIVYYYLYAKENEKQGAIPRKRLMEVKSIIV